MRVISEAEYCHERLGTQFAEALSDYDTQRRVEVLVDEFLSEWLGKVYWDPALFEGGSHDAELASANATIVVNPGWFKLALDNLFKNALRAMEDSDVKHLSVKTAAVDDTVEIIFADTGSGIPPQVLPKMFREVIPKGKGERGEGIGQLLSKTIIETYGGQIDILDTSEYGTSIQIRLPCTFHANSAGGTK